MSAAVEPSRAGTFEELRHAFAELLGAERRLRGRDSHRTGGLSHNQVRALFQLEAEESVTSGCLAKQAEMSPAAMTGMLDQLERDGMVTRTRSETDRRQVNVKLTDEGRARLAEKRTMWNAKWQEFLQTHTDTELETAVRVMRDVAGMLDTLGR